MNELITLEQYLNQAPTPSAELLDHAKDLLIKVNSMLQDMGITSVTMTSGYRPPLYNAAIGGATNSKHTTCQAIDLADNDRKLGNILKFSPMHLMKRGMAVEQLEYCVRANGNKWTHIQSVLPKSGKTFFIPYAGPIILK